MKYLALSLVVASASATPIISSSKYKRADLTNTDFELLNLARNLESLELAYWNQGLQNYTDADFAAANLTGYRDVLTMFRDHEIGHFTLLNEAAGGGFQNCTYNTFNVNNIQAYLQQGQVVTTVGEGAFIGALGLLTVPALRQSGGSILGNEARQNSKLRESLGLNFFNAPPFDTPLTASQAYSLAKPFLSGCPASNAPINFKLIPPIMANFTTPAKSHQAGDEVMVMWDPKAFYLGSDIHITFLSDVNAVPAPLNQNAANTGMGTVTLPANVYGTAILVATNYQGASPIPDEQHFGIGYLVVN